jgi:hypothetical protein
MASALQRGSLRSRGVPAYWRGSAHTVPGRARDALSVVVTVQWPRARRWGGAAGPGAPADKVS